MRRLALALSLLSLPALTLAADPTKTPKQAVPFALEDTTGAKVDVGAHFGKDVVLVSFFATWCTPCQAELPILQKLHEAHAAEGLKIVVVSIDDAKSAAKVKALVKDKGFTFPVLLDPKASVVTRYNPKRAIPFSAVVDRTGAVVIEKYGFQAGDAEKLEAELAGLLAPATTPAAPAPKE